MLAVPGVDPVGDVNRPGFPGEAPDSAGMGVRGSGCTAPARSGANYSMKALRWRAALWNVSCAKKA